MSLKFAPCPECGSTGVDEFVDGRYQCEDCGWPLEAKGAYEGVRCGVCNAIVGEPQDSADGTMSCDNCFWVLSHQVPDPDSDPLPIYPVLAWYCSPCQRCGAFLEEEFGDFGCPYCGALVVPIMGRHCAEGFPKESKTDRPDDAAPVLVGDQGVVGAGDALRGFWPFTDPSPLIPCDPFTLLEVTAIDSDGDLDVAAIHDGSYWMKVPQRYFLRLFR